MNHDLRKLAARLLAHAEDGDAPADGLDADLLSGYLEGRLAPDEQEVVEGRLAHDAAARAALGAPGLSSVRAGAARTPRRFRWQVAAAVLVLGVGVAALVLVGRAEEPEPPAPRPTLVPSDSSQRLRRLFERARQAAPGVSAHLAEIRARDLAEREPDEPEDGLVVLTPRGAVLDGAIEITWQDPQPKPEYAVRVRDADGQVVLDRTARTASLPPLASPLPAGEYVLEIHSVDDPQGTQTRRPFQVLPSGERERFELARSAIHAAEEGALVHLAEAHLALRFDLRGHALAAAERYLAEVPNDRLGQATHSHARGRLRFP